MSVFFRRHRREHNVVPKGWSGLRARVTISYISVTVTTMSLLVIIGGILFFTLFHWTSLLDTQALNRASDNAQLYALAVAAQTDGYQLDPLSTFEPGQPGTITIPVIESNSGFFWGNGNTHYGEAHVQEPDQQEIALLIQPDQRILASSEPGQYPTHTQIVNVLPGESAMIEAGLRGEKSMKIEITEKGRQAIAVVPVIKKGQQVLGVIFIRLPPLVPATFLNFFTTVWLRTNFLLLLIVTPFGLLFGTLSTRGLIRRIQRFVQATDRFARGQKDEHFQVSRHDELGYLEYRFKSMADQILESQAQQRTLTERTTRLEERTRIARELHDSVKQQLFAVSMQLGVALSLLDTQEVKIRTALQEADLLTNQAGQELTTLIHALRPSELQKNHLGGALREYTEIWSRLHSLPVELRFFVRGVLPDAVEEAFLRITQEALSNVARHSRATKVEVELRYGDRGWELLIRDNGQGFDPHGSWEGIGLISMRERMKALGGTVEIKSSKEQGTSILVRCPEEGVI